MFRADRRLGPVLGGLIVLSLLLAPAPAPGSREAVSGKHWVFFADKGLTRGEERAAVDLFASRLSLRALWRRDKVGKAVDISDLPVSREYVEAVSATGAEIVTRSRWLNAVSVFAGEGELRAVQELPFVREVRPVARAGKRPLRVKPPGGRGSSAAGDRSLSYGPSGGQLDQIQVPDLHDAGFDGAGVVIAMLDTGFDTDHQAYRHLDILAERDFINDDGETANEPGDPSGQDSHGTATLSCVGASYPGEIYGGSFGASFILCKTEMVDDEIEIEEDYWVEAIEWADSLGADLVSSSVGYFYWYTYADMDGNTAVITIGADMAAARGIVVVTSMGNEGGSDWHYMIAPADGDSVVGVGAVNIDGDRSWFSSVGPTYDGRIKPDVMALGHEAYVATTADTDSYAYSSGTSFSCPITAGAMGLLLQGHPEWTPQDVIDALHSTATQSASPDTLMGWGIVQAYDAMYSEPMSVAEAGEIAAPRLVWAQPNPSSPGVAIAYAVREAANVRLSVYDVSGRLVRVLFDGPSPSGVFVERWDGTDASGGHVSNGVYFVRASMGNAAATSKLALIR